MTGICSYFLYPVYGLASFVADTPKLQITATNEPKMIKSVIATALNGKRKVPKITIYKGDNESETVFIHTVFTH